MICDPLTKAGPAGFASRLINCMQTGYLDLEPTPESQLKKMKQQKMRMEKALQKSDPNGVAKAKAKGKAKAKARPKEGRGDDEESSHQKEEDMTSQECNDPEQTMSIAALALISESSVQSALHYSLRHHARVTSVKTPMYFHEVLYRGMSLGTIGCIESTYCRRPCSNRALEHLTR